MKMMRASRVSKERDQLNERDLLNAEWRFSEGYESVQRPQGVNTYLSVTASPNRSSVKSMQDSEKLRQKSVVDSLV